MAKKPAPEIPAQAAAPAADLVLLGAITSAHGIRGEVKIKSFAADPADIGAYGALVTADGRKLELKRIRPANESIVIAAVEGVIDRNQAEALRGLKLFVPRAQLPAAGPDEYYHADLIGLDAVDKAGTALGSVKDVLNFGAGDILEVAPAGGGESALYAFSNETVVSVDLAARRIVLAPPDEIE